MRRSVIEGEPAALGHFERPRVNHTSPLPERASHRSNTMSNALLTVRRDATATLGSLATVIADL